MSLIDTPQTQRANRRFIKTAMAAPLLESEHELNLARAWRERHDQRALHELTTAYMRLVVAMAAKFPQLWPAMGDLIQEGNIGLMQAAARFEPEREVLFSTYASCEIRSSIRTMCCAIGRSCALARRPRRNRSSSICAVCAPRSATGRRADVGGGPRGGRQETPCRAQRRRIDGIAPLGFGSLAQRGLHRERRRRMQDLLADDRPAPEEAVMELRDGETRAGWIREALKALSPRELTIIKERRLDRRQRDLGNARRTPRHFQGARAPDRKPGALEAQGRADAHRGRPGRSGTGRGPVRPPLYSAASATAVSAPPRPRPSGW